MQPVNPIEFMGLVANYCHIYNVCPTKLLLPKMSQNIPKIKLKFVLESIQRMWTEASTGRLWDDQEFYEFWWDVYHWVDTNVAQKCPSGANEVLWEGEMWKRGATEILGLNLKGE